MCRNLNGWYIAAVYTLGVPADRSGPRYPFIRLQGIKRKGRYPLLSLTQIISNMSLQGGNRELYRATMQAAFVWTADLYDNLISQIYKQTANS